MASNILTTCEETSKSSCCDDSDIDKVTSLLDDVSLSEQVSPLSDETHIRPLTARLHAANATIARLEREIQKQQDGLVEFLTSQDADIDRHIIEVIKSAKKFVDICVYQVNHPDIVSALITMANDFGIIVRIVLDEKSLAVASEYPSNGNKDLRTQYERLKKETKITVLTTTGRPESKFSASMHHKLMVVDGIVAIAGSANFTKAAARYNADNIIIIRHKSSVSVIHEAIKNCIKTCSGQQTIGVTP